MPTLTELMMQLTGVTEIRMRDPEAILVWLKEMMTVRDDFTGFLANAKTDEDRQRLERFIEETKIEIDVLRWVLGEDQSEAAERRKQFKVVPPSK